MKNHISFIHLIVALFAVAFSGCAGGNNVKIVQSQTPPLDTLAGALCHDSKGRLVPYASCSAGRNSMHHSQVANVTINNTVVKGGGGYAVQQPRQNMSRGNVQCPPGTREVRMAHCNNCGWDGLWELRLEHDCHPEIGGDRTYFGDSRQTGVLQRGGSYYSGSPVGQGYYGNTDSRALQPAPYNGPSPQPTTLGYPGRYGGSAPARGGISLPEYGGFRR